MTEVYQPQALVNDKYLEQKRQQAARARQVADSLPAFTPFGWGISDKNREDLASIDIEPEDVFGEGIFSNWLGQWKARDLAREKRRESREVLTPAVEAKRTNRAEEDFRIYRQDELQRRDREDRQKFDLNLNTQNLEARAREVQEQGKINMRQSMLDSVNNRRLAILNNPLKVLA